MSDSCSSSLIFLPTQPPTCTPASRDSCRTMTPFVWAWTSRGCWGSTTCSTLLPGQSPPHTCWFMFAKDKSSYFYTVYCYSFLLSLPNNESNKRWGQVGKHQSLSILSILASQVSKVGLTSDDSRGCVSAFCLQIWLCEYIFMAAQRVQWQMHHS